MVTCVPVQVLAFLKMRICCNCEYIDLSIDAVLKVQSKRYSLILYLIDYIAYGLYLLYKITIFEEICRKPVSLHLFFLCFIPRSISSSNYAPSCNQREKRRTAMPMLVCRGRAMVMMIFTPSVVQVVVESDRFCSGFRR